MFSVRSIPVIILTCICVALVPVAIGQTSAAGVLTLANRASISGANASSGSTVFSGDLITTQDDGQVQLQAGRTKLTLQPQSSFRVFRTGDRVVVELERGTMTAHLDNPVWHALIGPHAHLAR